MINIRMQQDQVQELSPKITVVGVGGAGGNAVNNMISSGLQGVEFLVCNTDAQALKGSLSDQKIQLGVNVTGGLGAGARPEVGSSAAEESLEEVLGYLDGANMVFITAGMGGGTGTGAAPVIARACREKGILTVGVVTKPFHFEGTLRMKMAEAGIEEMQEYVDTLIVIPNQNLFRVANEKTTFAEAFKMADGVLQSGVRGVTDLMVMPGLINLDFADIRSAMLEMGKAMMGTGESSGERRAIEAAEAAINNPLLDDVTMKGARGVIINVTGGYDMTLFEVDEACNRIRDEVDPNANIIFGSTFDEALDGMMRVSVVATGIDLAEQRAGHPQSPYSTVSGYKGGTQISRSVPKADVETDVKAGSVVEEEKGSSASVTRTPPGAVMPPLPESVKAAAPIVNRSPLMVSPMASLSSNVPQETVVDGTAIESKKNEEYGAGVSTSSSSTTGSLRGERYNDAFIPPAPVDPYKSASPSPAPQVETRIVEEERVEAVQASRQTSYVSQPYLPDSSLTASRSVESSSAGAASQGSGLTLKPPVPGARAQDKKKTASLFERFTSQLRHVSEEFRSDDKDEERGGTAGSTGGMISKPSISKPLQGSLNIDAPKTDDEEGELDIPAFLRRQAN